MQYSMHYGIVLALAGALLVASPAVAGPSPAPARPKKPVPSSHLKAYKGPEGAVIIMVEVNDNTQMLVHFRKVASDLDGKTVLWDFEDLGKGKKHVFQIYKRGSKYHRRYVLTARNGQWEFFHPTDHGKTFAISYSEAESEKHEVEDIVRAYKP